LLVETAFDADSPAVDNGRFQQAPFWLPPQADGNNVSWDRSPRTRPESKVTRSPIESPPPPARQPDQLDPTPAQHPIVGDRRFPRQTRFPGVSGCFRAFPGVSGRFRAFPGVLGRFRAFFGRHGDAGVAICRGRSPECRSLVRTPAAVINISKTCHHNDRP